MNMVGAPKHAVKACELGVDLICGQGGEGGGHTGEIPTTLLIPELVAVCKKYKSPLTGEPVQVRVGSPIRGILIVNRHRSLLPVVSIEALLLLLH